MWNDFDFQFHKKNDLKHSRKAPDNAINDARFASNNKGELGWAKTRPLSISSPYKSPAIRFMSLSLVLIILYHCSEQLANANE